MDNSALIVKRATDKAFASLIPARLDSPKARALMYAITRQESRWVYRDQLEAGGRNTIIGPALGLGQFEQGGGVKGVMTHPASTSLAQSACRFAGVKWDRHTVWLALAASDALAMAFVRLLLLTDAAALPEVDHEDEAWAYYLRCWRPGAYTRGDVIKRAALRDEWHRSYTDALALLRAGDDA